jgi:PAS domain S-box-containing protein
MRTRTFDPKREDGAAEPVTASGNRTGGWLSGVLVFAAYLLGAEIGHWLSAEPGHFSTFWPNSGLYLAVLLRTPPRRWWVVVTAAAAANLTSDVLLHRQPLPVALGFVLANTAEAAVGAAVVRHLLGASARLDNLRSVLVVFVVASAVSTPLGGLVGAATVSTAFGASMPQAWQVWWVADALGVLLTAPLVLGLHDRRGWPRPARLLEGAALLAGLVAGGVFVFTSVPHVAPIVLLLFLLWAAIRLDTPGVAAAAFVLAVVAVRCTVLGYGIFTETGDLSQRIVSVQLFVAVPALVFYSFAVVLAERRRAEAGLDDKVRERTAALDAQRELLSVTLTSIGDAVVTTDTAGRVTGLNTVAETLTGWATADAVGQPLAAVFHIVNETTRQPVENPALRALERGAIVGLANHTVLIARDGTEWPIDDSAAPIRSKTGEIVGSVLVFRDITERKRAEEQVRASEEQFRSMADHAPTMLWVTDPSGSCTYIGRRWCEYTGTTAEENLGVGWLGCVHPDDRPRSEATFLDANARHTPFALDYRIRRRDGEYHWCIDAGTPRFDAAGVYQGFVGAVTDVHDRKLAEERFRLAADAVNGIIYEYDFATGHVERTRGLCEVLGYRTDEVPPTADWWWEQTHPDDREGNRQRFEAVNGGTTRNEYRVRHRDGRWLHVEDRAVLLRGDDGRPVRMVGCTVDVTDRKEAEARLRASEERFRVAIKNSPILVYTCDRNLRYEWFYNNPARYAHLDVIGKRDDEVLPAEVVADIVAFKAAVVASGVGGRREILFDSGDGPEFYGTSRGRSSG